MSEKGSSRVGTLAVFGIAILVNLVLTILLLDQVVRTRSDVAGLTEGLASKQDVAMLRPIRVDEILARRCEGCHTDRRFAKLKHLSQSQVLKTIQRMRTHPGADIPADEIRQIESALLVFRCTSCHSEAVLSRVVLMPPEERRRFMRDKVRMPGSGFRPDQAGEILAALDVLVGSAVSDLVRGGSGAPVAEGGADQSPR